MKRREKKSENNERWLLTYSDLITLLMIFFVVMYASSTVNSAKYESLSTSLNSVLGSSGGSGDTPTPVVDTNGTGIVSETTKLENLQGNVDEILLQYNLSDKVHTKLEESGLAIIFDNDLLFDSAKAVIKPEIKDSLNKIAEPLKALNTNLIRVEGHTDILPIHNEEFSSNWQLSSVRAANVVQYLNETCSITSNRLSAVGYGSEKPIGDNNTESGRNSNRRVEIILIKNTDV